MLTGPWTIRQRDHAHLIASSIAWARMPVHIEDGMFAEHWDELNMLEVFQQLGVIPSLGAGRQEQPS